MSSEYKNGTRFGLFLDKLGGYVPKILVTAFISTLLLGTHALYNFFTDPKANWDINNATQSTSPFPADLLSPTQFSPSESAPPDSADMGPPSGSPPTPEHTGPSCDVQMENSTRLDSAGNYIKKIVITPEEGIDILGISMQLCAIYAQQLLNLTACEGGLIDGYGKIDVTLISEPSANELISPPSDEYIIDHSQVPLSDSIRILEVPARPFYDAAKNFCLGGYSPQSNLPSDDNFGGKLRASHKGVSAFNMRNFGAGIRPKGC